MCLPEPISTALALASSAVGATQAQARAKAQSRNQAASYAQQAEAAREQAQARERDLRRQTSRDLARQRALAGGSGVKVGTGSPLLAAEDFAAEAENQAQLVRAKGETAVQAWNDKAAQVLRAGEGRQTAIPLSLGSLLARR